LKHFGPCIVGKKLYGKIMGQQLFSDIATISDEAFAYFTIERCWESWESAMSNNEEGKKTTVRPKYSKHKTNKNIGDGQKQV